MKNGELSFLGISFRGRRGIKNFKVEFSPVTSSLEETLSKSYHISPAREKLCHENPSGLAGFCRGGDFCQQRALPAGSTPAPGGAKSPQRAAFLPTWQLGKTPAEACAISGRQKRNEKAFREIKSQCGVDGRMTTRCN